MKHKNKATKPAAPLAPGVARERLQKVQAQFAQDNADAARRFAPRFIIGTHRTELTVEVDGEIAGTLVPGKWVFQPGEFKTTLKWIDHPAGVDAAVQRKIAEMDAPTRARGVKGDPAALVAVPFARGEKGDA